MGHKKKQPDFIIHTQEEIEGIKRAAKITAVIRDEIASQIRIGMSTKMVDDISGAIIADYGGVSAFLGYKGFPGQICISVNDQVVHGIGKSDKILKYGDIVSIDVGVKYQGYIGDTAVTIALGEVNSAVQKLLDATYEGLINGIKAALPGKYIRNISRAVELTAKRFKLGIVRDYVGHGCGCELHEPPEIPNFVNSNKGPMLQPGMTLCIEPMFNLGSHKVFTEIDKWTVCTKDGKPSAHFEHMILITEKGQEVLTWGKI